MLTTICTCDKCGTVITDSNKMPEAIFTPLKGTEHMVEAKFPYYDSHLCLHCFIDAVNALDDRPKETPAKGRTE